ncbi:TadE/TadG family type IV pilus assembly protein [Pelagibacterium limicola]|uniref:TadE/TadG family type IV pilus assembly protein n=1 Tax=Pelagibacterium limicola TaxID=2791022 RepID=UPI0018AFD793|nr:TadE/TadG family type IV pilus assembly protein [Pelagibacterium limicola]
MKSAHRSPLSLARLFARRVMRADGGATAVEFGLLAPIFFAIIGAAMETALVFFAGQALDSAVHDSSRLIRTGQVHQQALSASQYRADICGRLLGMFDCNQLRITVREIQAFTNFSTGNPLDAESGEWSIQEQYQPGTGGSIVVVEAYYKWPTIIAVPGLMTGVTADGKRLLASARVFRNEPFTFPAPPPGNS